ncbi:hypothetical protein HFP65_23185 [Bacillus sp. CB62A.1]
MSDFVISENTRNSISTINAPRPKLDPRDPNIGKIALVKEGAYKGLKGIIYPPTKELKYDGEFVKGFTGHYEVEKLYHVMFFFEDGTFFCAMETDLMDLEVEGGYSLLMTEMELLQNPMDVVKDYIRRFQKFIMNYL